MASEIGELEVFCNACNIPVDDKTLHYKTEWHRYNVKRKVSKLPHIPEDVFAQQVLEAEQQDAGKQNQDHGVAMPNSSEGYTGLRCLYCSKTFHNSMSYQQHLLTKKHKKNVETASPELQEGEAHLVLSACKYHPPLARGDSRLTDVLSETESKCSEGEGVHHLMCLFCRDMFLLSENLVKHLAKSHSFFLPYILYLKDLDGFLEFLFEEVSEKHTCLFCHVRTGSLMSIQQHMSDKGHCKLRFSDEDVESYIAYEFYDFQSHLNQEEEKHNTETKSDDESKNAEDEMDNNQQTIIDQRTPVFDHAFIPISALGELRLPSGRILGHRANRIYYRQAGHASIADNRIRIRNIAAQYQLQLPGWTDNKQQHIGRWQKLQQRVAREKLQLQVKANKFQTHFRPQVNF